MSKPSVAVLMSTYNGQKYLSRQIESILTQKGVEVTLVIRDDSSLDDTQIVLEEYAGAHDNILYYRGKNVGVGMSFMRLLEKAPHCDYYAFSDQDDIWLEEKLIRAVETIKDVSGPALYASNLILVDKDGREIGLRDSIEPKHSLIDCVVRNYMNGCTMLLNNEMRDKLVGRRFRPNKRILDIRYHDAWSMLVAQAIGSVYYDSNGYIHYRQHENNVVGALKPTGMEALKQRISDYLQLKYRGMRRLCAGEILRLYSEYLDEEAVKKLQIVADSNTFKGAFRLICDPDIRDAFEDPLYKMLIKLILRWY